MNKVLFVCIHNSARSQIAEALLNKYGKCLFDVKSAGFESSEINPLAIEVLKREENIDISNNNSNSVFKYFQDSAHFNFVIAVCDEGNAQRCPLFPGLNFRLHWSFKDPRDVTGTDEEKYLKVKSIYENIKIETLKFIDLVEKDILKDEFPKNWRIG